MSNISLDEAREMLNKAQQEQLKAFVNGYAELCKQWGYEFKAEPVMVRGSNNTFSIGAQLVAVRTKEQ